MARESNARAAAVALLFLAAAPPASCATGPARGESAPVHGERIVGGPCEGCEEVFAGIPVKLAAEARIAQHEPGEPLVLEGTVRDAKGAPASGVIVYAYHTDRNGIYPRSGIAGVRHGRLRSWAQTGADGVYRFRTIRPAGYPDTSIPQHIHMHVIEPGRCTYWIDDVLFEDDPRLTEGERSHLQGRGGPGVLRPTREAPGAWRAVRDISLGEAIPGYQDCSAPLPG